MVPFREAVIVDFEYRFEPGGLPHVVCGVFRGLRSGRELRFWGMNSSRCGSHRLISD
jgi:hypothetical protein